MLAGGLSTRMGRDKAKLTLDGTTLLETLLARLRAAGFSPGVAGLRGPLQRGQRQCESAPFTVSVVEDNIKDAGPLGGLEAALRSLAAEAEQPVLFVAVDLPLLPLVFLQTLWNRATTTGARATVPFVAGRPQPLCAVYRSGLAPGLAEALARGERKVMQVVRSLTLGADFDGFRVEALAPLAGWGSPGRWFTNVNTPADYRALERAPFGNRIYQGKGTP